MVTGAPRNFLEITWTTRCRSRPLTRKWLLPTSVCEAGETETFARCLIVQFHRQTKFSTANGVPERRWVRKAVRAHIYISDTTFTFQNSVTVVRHAGISLDSNFQIDLRSNFRGTHQFSMNIIQLQRNTNRSNTNNPFCNDILSSQLDIKLAQTWREVMIP